MTIGRMEGKPEPAQWRFARRACGDAGTPDGDRTFRRLGDDAHGR